MWFLKSRIKRMTPKEMASYYKKNNIVKIGECCEIDNTVNFGSEPYLIKLGNKVRIASGVKFITHDGGMWVIRNLGMNKEADKIGPIVVGNNVFIGVDAILLPNVKVGNNVIIGCRSIVTKDIPDNSVVAGAPARVICTIEEFYKKNQDRIYSTKNMKSNEKKEYYLDIYKDIFE